MSVHMEIEEFYEADNFINDIIFGDSVFVFSNNNIYFQT